MASYNLSYQVTQSYLSNTLLLGNIPIATAALAVNGNKLFFSNNYNSPLGSQIVYSTTEGTTWSLGPTSFPNNPSSFSSISVNDIGHVFACGSQGAFYSTNLGKSFYAINNPSGFWGYSNGAVGTLSKNGQVAVLAEIGYNSGNYTTFNRLWKSSDFGYNWNLIFGNGVYLHDSYFNNTTIIATNSSLLISSDGQVIVVLNSVHVAVSVNSGYSWGFFGGTTPSNPIYNQNIRSVAMSEDGSTIAVSVINLGVFLSTDYGVSCTRVLQRNTGTIGMSGNGRVMAVNDWNNGYFSISTNSGATWTGFNGNVPNDIRFNYDGSKFYNVAGGSVDVYTYGTLAPTIVLDASKVVPINGTYTAVARTKSVSVRVDSNDLRSVTSVRGNENLVDDLNTVNITMSDGVVYKVYIMVLRNCFKEDTKILCYVNNEEKYIPVQEMKKGTLVKTSMNGYIPVHSIGHAKIFNPANKLRGLNRLYKCTNAMYPEITEDLVITGCHSILMDIEKLTPELKAKTKDITGREELTTDTKWRLMAVLDERADPYEEEGTFTIWHFALDHFDEFMNYGVYANGLLVETCDINMMREHSGLEIV